MQGILGARAPIRSGFLFPPQIKRVANQHREFRVVPSQPDASGIFLEFFRPENKAHLQPTQRDAPGTIRHLLRFSGGKVSVTTEPYLLFLLAVNAHLKIRIIQAFQLIPIKKTRRTTNKYVALQNLWVIASELSEPGEDGVPIKRSRISLAHTPLNWRGPEMVISKSAGREAFRSR